MKEERKEAACPFGMRKFDAFERSCSACKVKCRLREEWMKAQDKTGAFLEDVSDAYAKYEGKLLLG